MAGLIATKPRRVLTCDHCKNSVEPALEVRTDRGVYCCAGCRAVAETLSELGLDDYYSLRDESAPSPRIEARADPAAHAKYDEPTLFESITRLDPDGTRRVDLVVEGAHCAGCVWVLERLPNLVTTVASARLELPRGVLRLALHPETTGLSSVFEMLSRLGYNGHPLRGDAEARVRRREERGHWLRMGVAFTSFANAMLFAFALYGDHFQGMSPEWRATFRWLGFACAAISLAFPGRVFLAGAWTSVRSRRPHMDLPVALALSVGTLWGGVNCVRGVGEVYFESLTAVIFLLSIGRYLQFRQQRAAADSIELLYSMTPRLAHRVTNGMVATVPVDVLEPGDLVEVRPGETVPADGVLETGRSDFDNAFMTGESVPRPLMENDAVVAGAVNVSATVRIRVSNVGVDTRLGRLLSRMREEITARAAVVRLADRAAHRLISIVLVAALATFVWWSRVSFEIAAEHAIALLIVTCPCALGLATPLAIEVALGRAAARGILVKNGEVIETLSRRGTILLDKTGTVTSGVAVLLDFEGDEAALRDAALLERDLGHPYARALASAAGAVEGLVVDRRLVVGGGVVGLVENVPVAVGNRAFLEGLGIERDGSWREVEERMTSAGRSPVEIARAGRVVAACGFGDPPRPEARRTITALRELGFSIELLSGDHPAIVRSIARAIGIPEEFAEGSASPERKIERVAETRARGELVVMVGDGVNDAAALAKADVGIAQRGGAEASLEAADVYLSRGDLTSLIELIVGCRRTLSVVRGNLIASAAYNVIAGSLAITGVLHPWMAAVLMPLSSLTVVALSFRRRTFEPLVEPGP